VAGDRLGDAEDLDGKRVLGEAVEATSMKEGRAALPVMEAVPEMWVPRTYMVMVCSVLGMGANPLVLVIGTIMATTIAMTAAEIQATMVTSILADLFRVII
jgi:hypothetical protein